MKSKKDTAFVAEEKGDSAKVILDNDFICLMSKINSSKYTTGASSWIADSGRRTDITFVSSLFRTYEPVANATVEMGTNATVQVIERGSIVLKMQFTYSFQSRNLDDVLHVPSFE